MSNNSDEAFEKFKEYDFADAKPVSAVPVLARLQAEKAADRVGTRTCPPYQANFTELTITELLATHSAVLDELRHRNVIRSKNNPTGDYAEWLVSTKLGLTLETNSAKGFDATDSQGLRYQIKGRRVTPENKSTQLGVIRNLDGKDFDFLVAVVFDANWQVHYAAKIPHQTVPLLATFRQHVNGHTLHLRPTVFDNPSVEDISHELLN